MATAALIACTATTTAGLTALAVMNFRAKSAVNQVSNPPKEETHGQ
jgi:hypothetical protein